MSVEYKITYPDERDSRKLVLYKYVSRVGLTSFLANRDLKLSFPKEANDPFELTDANSEPDMLADFEKVGFLSLSTDNNSPSMWGNYAEKYRGACLKFELQYCAPKGDRFDGNVAHWLGLESDKDKKLGKPVYFFRRWRESNEEGRSFSVEGSRGDKIYKCQYSDVRPDLGILEKQMETSPFPFNRKRKVEMVHLRYTTKHRSWKNEKEYRLVYNKSEASRISSVGGEMMFFINDITSCLREIVLGPLCKTTISDVYFALRKNWGDDISAPIVYRRAEFQQKSYLLNFQTKALAYKGLKDAK